MSKIEIALSSPAFYTLVGLFVYHGLEGIAPGLSGTLGNIVQTILALLTVYLHPTELKIAGRTGMLGSRKI